MQKVVHSRSEVNRLIDQGWRVMASNSQSQGYNFGKTCCLGLIFLPLALLGKKKDTIEYILEKD